MVKGRTVKTATQKAKEKRAKTKVDKLLEDVGIGTKEKPVKATAKTAETKKNTKWLEDENDRLTKVNVDLENKLIASQTDFKKAFDELKASKANGAGAPMDDSEIKKMVIQHFRDLEDAHLGRNPERTIYKTTTPLAQLDKMVKRFPFLKEMVTK